MPLKYLRAAPLILLVLAAAADPDHPAYRGTPGAAGGTCCQTLGEVRTNIDRIDAEIVRLIGEREGFVLEAGRFKDNPSVVEDPKRVEQIMLKVRALAEREHAAPDVVEATYRAMLASLLEVEKNAVATDRLCEGENKHDDCQKANMVSKTAPAESSAQIRPSVDERQIVDAVSSVFAALSTDDVRKFDSVIGSDFYLFERGVRFDRDGMLALLKAQQAAGKRFEWNVTEPDVHVSGDAAWIAYVNKGSIADASGTTSQKWLESAFLQKQSGIWKIVFLHSTRVPSPESKAQP